MLRISSPTTSHYNVVMVAKITSAKLLNWLERGDIDQLAEYWTNPYLRHLRQELLDAKVNGSTYWRKAAYSNGKTLGWLARYDNTIQASLPMTSDGTLSMEAWTDFFMGDGVPDQDLFGLLPIAPKAIQSLPMLEMLDSLMTLEAVRLKAQQQSGLHGWGIRLKVWAEVHNGINYLSRRYEGRGLLPALAWLGMGDHWDNRSAPRLANIIQQAARDNPAEVLGAYLIAHHGLVLRGRERFHRYYPEVADGICDNMMRHLLTNAFVAGMDTTAFEEHAKTFWEIRSALGSETTAIGAVAYAQGVLGQGAGLSIPVPDGMALL